MPVHLAPQQEMVFSLNVYCECNGTKREVVSFDDALHRVHCEKNASPLASIDIYTSNEQPVLRESSPANSFIPSEGLLPVPFTIFPVPFAAPTPTFLPADAALSQPLPPRRWDEA